LRNLWLFPLCIVVAGAIINTGLTFAMGSVLEAFRFFVSELAGLLQLLVVVAVVALTPLRRVFDQIRLSLPWIGELEREIAVNRFFRVMSLLYGVGNIRVEVMIRTAAKTVTNREAHSDFLKAATAIENKATIAEAFQRVTILSDDEKGTIDVGELSGTLEQAFHRIAEQSEASLMAKLAFLQPLLTRLVMAFVAFSIVTTLFGLIMRSG
jgi:type II secretory pathway component PulF